MWRVATCAMAFVLLFTTNASANSPYPVATARQSSVQKSTKDQRVTGHWQNFAGVKPVKLNGKRALFFVQLHINCTKRPKYVKLRLARLTPHGKDTTGTTTFSFTKNTTRDWQGTMWWESKTKYPIMAQYKVVGGKCYSDQRQLKWWQP